MENLGIKVKNIDHFIDILENSEDGAKDFYILFDGGVRSSKFISYDGEIFYIINLIDSSEEELTLKELLDPKISNIGLALEKGILYAYN